MTRTMEKMAEVARSILDGSLHAGSEDTILLVFDGTSLDIADAFAREAAHNNVAIHSVYFPFQNQVSPNASILSTLLQDCVRSSTILVTALTDAPDATNFRKSLLASSQKEGLKIIHMPGVSSGLLISSVPGLDFEALDASARELASSLTSSSLVEVLTTSQSGEECRLLMTTKGRQGHADGGVARPTEIINMPTGESYIAPLESSSVGRIIINGSLPDYVFQPGEELILGFKEGRLDEKSSEIPDTPGGAVFSRILERLKDAGASCLALGEFGVGLNMAVTSLVGDALVDEKQLGTAHIALGSNTNLGGCNECHFHHDIVFFPKAVLLDGVPLEIDWRQPEDDV